MLNTISCSLLIVSVSEVEPYFHSWYRSRPRYNSTPCGYKECIYIVCTAIKYRYEALQADIFGEVERILKFLNLTFQMDDVKTKLKEDFTSFKR